MASHSLSQTLAAHMPVGKGRNPTGLSLEALLTGISYYWEEIDDQMRHPEELATSTRDCCDNNGRFCYQWNCWNKCGSKKTCLK